MVDGEVFQVTQRPTRRGQGGRAWHPSGGPVTPPPAVLRAPGVFGENILLGNFLEFSEKVDFCTKIDTKGNSAENSISPC